MGQKVNSNGLRYGIYKDWESKWISNDTKQTAQWLVQDDKIRTYFERTWKTALVSRVQIERRNNEINLFVNTAQPGLFGEPDTVKKITLDLNKICGRQYKISLNFIPILKTYVNARLVAREIADSIEHRVSFRTAQKQLIKKVMKSGALGIKTRVSGRLGGVEMAREEGYSEGVIPLSTLRADVDYALEEAHTTYGLIGVKVWINRGIIFHMGEISKVCLEAPAPSYNKYDKSRSNNFKRDRSENKRTEKPEQTEKPVQASTDEGTKE